MLLRSAPPEITPHDLDLPQKFSQYRPKQYETALKLALSDARFPQLSAPTGAGKSPIYFTVSRLLNCRTLILAPTKALQAQLIDDFGCVGAFSITGHSNYSCAQSKFTSDGDVEVECRVPRDQCQYWRDIETALTRQVVITNPAHWICLSKANDADRLGKFDFIVVDEAHNAPDILVDQLSVRLTESNIDFLLHINLPDNLSKSSWISWLDEALRVCRSEYSRISKQDKEDRQDRQDNRLQSANGRKSKELIRITNLGIKLAFLQEGLKSNSRWIAEHLTFTAGVSWSPVWAAQYSEDYLFRGAEKILLTSGTLLPNTSHYLGISKHESEFTELASTFHKSRRPIIYIPTTRVDHKWTDGQKAQLVNRINQIVASRLDRKNIIHSRSYELGLRHILPRMMLRDIVIAPRNRHETSQAIETYLESDPPSILMSPALQEGYDFAGDKCRVQILPKLPYIDSRNPLIKARLEEDKSYSTYEVSKSIVQTCGRIVRGQEDWGETFILDDHWAYFQSKGKFAKWFKSAFVTRSMVPEPISF